MLAARRQIQWRILGIDPKGNHIFEITNSSGRRVPAMTVGVRSTDGRLNGAIRLNIGDLFSSAPDVAKVRLLEAVDTL